MSSNFDSKSNAAVMLGEYSFVFFSNTYHQLSYLWFKGPETARGGAKAYVPISVFARKPGEPAGNPINLDPESPQVTAVSWNDAGEYHLRVYYIDPEAGYVKEICWDTRDPGQDANWFHGDFNDSIEEEADKAAPLTSLIQVGGVDQLKVYFKRASSKSYRVAYANVGATNWSQREIFKAH